MALVLTRRKNESIVLMEEGKPDCRITVIGWEKHGNNLAIRLAIDAPLSVDVVREELLKRDEPWRGREPNAKDQVRD